MLIKGDSISTCARDFGDSLEKMNVFPLSNSSTINCGDAKLKVIHTPGHTSGSISFYEPSTKSLFSGDAVFADGGVGRWDLATGDYNTLLISISELFKLGALHLYPGHGPYVKDNAQEHIKMAMRNLQNDFL
jgi:glyoxylase-like metal-dependent hydrolase (beta-lactamase superfamily II)